MTLDLWWPQMIPRSLRTQCWHQLTERTNQSDKGKKKKKRITSNKSIYDSDPLTSDDPWRSLKDLKWPPAGWASKGYDTEEGACMAVDTIFIPHNIVFSYALVMSAAVGNTCRLALSFQEFFFFSQCACCVFVWVLPLSFSLLPVFVILLFSYSCCYSYFFLYFCVSPFLFFLLLMLDNVIDTDTCTHTYTHIIDISILICALRSAIIQC